jgi:hypothetical protein
LNILYGSLQPTEIEDALNLQSNVDEMLNQDGEFEVVVE